MRLFLLILIFGFVSTPAPAKTVGKASFLATASGLGIDIEAENAPVDGTVKRDGDKVSGTFTVVLKDFKTGIALRDEHMQKALEVEKFPKAVFTLEPVLLSGEAVFSGTLELHGQRRPVSGKATLKGSQVSAALRLKLTDFGITPPNYKIAKVGDEVEVKIAIAL